MLQDDVIPHAFIEATSFMYRIITFGISSTEIIKIRSMHFAPYDTFFQVKCTDKMAHRTQGDVLPTNSKELLAKR